MSWWDRGWILVACLVVCGPALFTHNGFGEDFTNHLWLVEVQTRAIRANGVPTYFLNVPLGGIFYPFFMFYGGTLYAVAGALGVVLGDSGTAGFLAVCVLAVAAAYGGLLWLVRQLGVRGWMGHTPAITYVASAYYITDFYGRGAWPEFVATSFIPLVAASALAVARVRKLGRVAPILLVLSTMMFAGSHNITLLLGSVFLVLVLALLGLALGRGLWVCGPRRLLVLGGLFGLGIGLDAWFLLPDIHDGALTTVGMGPLFPWGTYGFLNTPGLVFNPLRSVPAASGTKGLYVQAPDWFLFWALRTLTVVWKGAHRGLRRISVAVILLLSVVLGTYLIPGVWNHLPHLLREAQFPYRVDTYVALTVAGLVLVVLLLIQDRPERRRALRIGIPVGLILVTLVSVGLAVWQLWVPNVDFGTSYTNRRLIPNTSHLTPNTWYAVYDYSDATGPILPNPSVTESVPLTALNSNSATITINTPAALVPFTIGLAAGPYAVRVSDGIIRLGRTATGQEVFERAASSSGPIRVTLAPVAGAVRIGLFLTLASLAIALALLIAAFVVGLRRPVAMIARRVRS